VLRVNVLALCCVACERSSRVLCCVWTFYNTRGVAASKLLGVRRIFAEFPQTCPKSCSATFAYKYSPTNIMKTFYGVTFRKKRSSFVFLQTSGAIFGVKQCWAPWSFRDVAQIVDKSKLLGPPPAPLYSTVTCSLRTLTLSKGMIFASNVLF